MVSSPRTVLTDRIPEKSSGQVTFNLTDADGSWDGNAPDTFTLTLYVGGKSTVYINSRNKQNVNGANGVTIDAPSGACVWLMDPADNAITDPTCDTETHIALFEWTKGSSQGRHELALIVQNMANVS